MVGAYSYCSLQSFYGGASGVLNAYANNYRTVYSTDPKNPKPVANVKAAQLAFYVQDAFSIKDNFKRANLALDQKLPLGIIESIEEIYTKALQDILYYDLNLAPSTSNLVLGNSERPFYESKINSTYSNIYSLSNTQKGYSYKITVSLFRRVKGWTTSLAYCLGPAYSINDGTSSTAASQYRYVYGIQGSNNAQLSRCNYDLVSRIVGYVGKKFIYG